LFEYLKTKSKKTRTMFNVLKGGCPCCKNPWSVGEHDASVFALACEPCKKDVKGMEGVDPADFDESVNPMDNFCEYQLCT
jgi:hypothetical protein